MPHSKPSPKAQPSTEPPGGRQPPARIRILLVEDDEVDVMAFVRYVEAHGLGYECTIAQSLAEVRALPNMDRFDVVLLDHRLRDGTGLEVLPVFRETPVIFITGSESPEVAAHATKAGASVCLFKDDDRTYLTFLPATIERVLRQPKEPKPFS